ncbi:MAG: Imm27 family immunity protein [Bermanella sp.]
MASMNKLTGSQAITFLEKNCIKVTTDESGWEILYKEKSSNKYWELTYPNSEMHGGGEPLVSPVAIEDVKLKFDV